jgi:hypothetical protein
MFWSRSVPILYVHWNFLSPITENISLILSKKISFMKRPDLLVRLFWSILLVNRWPMLLRLFTVDRNIFIASGVGLSPLHCGHFWPIVPTLDHRWGWFWSNWWNEDWQWKPKYSEKTCPSATLSTANPTWPDPGSNPGRRGGKPATTRRSYCAATPGP